jgi:nucleoside-diphosphate-sugar epimerase
MKILVTGSSGFLGSVLVERLLERGQKDIRCFVRPGSNMAKLDALKQKYPDGELEFFVGNLTSKKDAAEAVKGVKLVYHLAAAMKGDAADMFLNSVVASKYLLEAVVKRKTTKVVLCSSMGVYGVSDQPAGFVVNEHSPLEPRPEDRDVYSYSKWRQEQLFREYNKQHSFPLTILRPGVIYGPGGAPMSSRVGVNLFGLFLHLGRGNVLPLSYVTNCADAIALAGLAEGTEGEVFNVVDDGLPTSRQFLKRYRRDVKGIKFVPVPYFLIQALSIAVEKYHSYSKGQLPAIFTPYKSAAIWKGNLFDNSKIKAIGWKQLVSTEEGLTRAFSYLRDNADV